MHYRVGKDILCGAKHKTAALIKMCCTTKPGRVTCEACLGLMGESHIHDDDGTVEGCPGCFADRRV